MLWWSLPAVAVELLTVSTGSVITSAGVPVNTIKIVHLHKMFSPLYILFRLHALSYYTELEGSRAYCGTLYPRTGWGSPSAWNITMHLKDFDCTARRSFDHSW